MLDFIKKVSFKIVSTAFEDSIESLNQNNMALFESLIDDLLNKNIGQNLDNMLLNMKIIDQWLN